MDMNPTSVQLKDFEIFQLQGPLNGFKFCIPRIECHRPGRGYTIVPHYVEPWPLQSLHFKVFYFVLLNV